MVGTDNRDGLYPPGCVSGRQGGGDSRYLDLRRSGNNPVDIGDGEAVSPGFRGEGAGDVHPRQKSANFFKHKLSIISGNLNYLDSESYSMYGAPYVDHWASIMR